MSLPNIQPMANADSLPDGVGAESLPNEKSGLAGLFEELMALALSPPTNESITLNQKNHQPISEVKGTGTPAQNADTGASNKLKSALGLITSLESGSTISGKSVASSIESDTSTGNSSPEQTKTLTVTISDLEIIAEQLIAATLPSDNLPAKAIRPMAPDASPAPPLTDATVKSTAVLAASAQAKQISNEVTKISHADLSDDQTAQAAQSQVVPKASLPVFKDGELPAKDSDSSSPVDVAAISSSKATLNFESDNESPKDSDPSSAMPAQPPPESSGIPIAKQDMSMNQAEKTNKIAGQTEKVLPGNVVSASSGSSSQLFSARAAEFTSAAATGVSSAASLNEVAALPVDSTIVQMPSVPDSRLIERTQDMVSLNAMRLTDSGNNSMQVVIKPDAGTQLSLELRQHNGGVEVQAVLQQGDFNHLSQQWPDLQHRLDQRGIRLAPLDDNAMYTNNSSSETSQQKQNRTNNSVQEPAFTNVPIGLFTPEPAKTSAHRGWETWA